jgi:hypothetical protein
MEGGARRGNGFGDEAEAARLRSRLRVERQSVAVEA